MRSKVFETDPAASIIRHDQRQMTVQSHHRVGGVDCALRYPVARVGVDVTDDTQSIVPAACVECGVTCSAKSDSTGKTGWVEIVVIRHSHHLWITARREEIRRCGPSEQERSRFSTPLTAPRQFGKQTGEQLPGHLHANDLNAAHDGGPDEGIDALCNSRYNSRR